MVEMELIDLLRQLEMIVEEAPAKAFSHKVVVDRRNFKFNKRNEVCYSRRSKTSILDKY